MGYKLVFWRGAIADLDALAPEIRKRIIVKLAWFAEQENPLVFARRLIDPALGTYRYRVGDWRIIVDVEHDTIIILVVDHRNKIYRR